MKEPRREARRWLKQAVNDLDFAKLGFTAGFHAQVCFQCQQICEKALKSIHYGKLGKRIVFGHSLVELSGELQLNQKTLEDLAVLDQYYIPTRYPNGLPGGMPYEVYTRKQAENALKVSKKIIRLAEDSLESRGKA